MESPSTLPGRRESSKLDKRRRISAAARAVFTEFGYERANMREIAKRAGVATGTLFLYAPDKRNLLLWILNDDLDRITAATFAEIAAERAPDDLLGQLLYAFEARYRYWGADPDLSLHALQELIAARDVQATPASHLGYYHDRRVVLHERIADLVRAQQRRGNLRANADPDAVARLALAIYNAAIRTWLRGSEVDLAQGLDELRQLLRLAIEGCTAANGHGTGGTAR